ncbi:hypothetical protein Syun_007108 [Stephania yunnanensis]|uniref:Uncharacterized protein n=1 Tax=Stephania yunnanensis TaxID=152371 RepID=A0AAP0KXV3_9MAGN
MRRRFGLGLGMIVGLQFAVRECGGAANIALHVSHYQQQQEIFRLLRAQARPAVTEVTHVRVEIISPIPETPAEDTPSTPIDTGVKATVEVRQACEPFGRGPGESVAVDGSVYTRDENYVGALQQPTRQTLSISTIRGLMAEAVARDKVRDPVECTDMDFNVSVWACGQPGTDSCYCHARLLMVDHETKMFICIPIYVASMLPWHILMGGGKWCVHCLEVTEEPSSSRRSPAFRGGAQLFAEEPSSSWKSPALQSKMGVWPWASMALGGYGDAASDDRVCLALAPAFGGLRLLGHLSISFPLTLILVILLDFTYLGSSISCLTECRVANE